MQHMPSHFSPNNLNRFLTFVPLLMGATGMRLSDVLRLTPASIGDGTTREIRASSPRAKTVRTVKVCPELAQALQSYLTRSSDGKS